MSPNSKPRSARHLHLCPSHSVYLGATSTGSIGGPLLRVTTPQPMSACKARLSLHIASNRSKPAIILVPFRYEIAYGLKMVPSTSSGASYSPLIIDVLDAIYDKPTLAPIPWPPHRTRNFFPTNFPHRLQAEHTDTEGICYVTVFPTFLMSAGTTESRSALIASN